MSIMSLLASENFITVNRDIAKVVGLEAAVVLGELVSEYMYWQERDDLQDGWFFSTVENLESKTFLSAHSQRQALDKLKEFGLVDYEKRGMPAKRYIKLFEDNIENLVNDKSLKILTTSDQNSSRQVVKNFDGKKTEDKKTEEKDIRIKDKGKSLTTGDLLSQVPVIENNQDLKDAFLGFVEMRKKMKAPPTERAMKMLVNETFRLGGGDPVRMKAIIDQSTKNGWKGVYPLKDNHSGAENPFTEMLRQEGYQ